MNEAEGLGEESMTIPEPATDEGEDGEVDVAEMIVIDTCMDVRRGENILIICDPTTTEIGQALHDAASLRSGPGALGGHAQRTPPRG